MAKLGAGVRKRTDGTLEKRFTVKGKRYSVYGKSQKEISAKEQDIRKKIDAGIYTDNRNVTLDEYFNEWIENKRSTLKGCSVWIYSNYYNNHIKPEMGKRKVQQIERREVLRLQNRVSNDLSISATNMTLRILKAILNDAVKDEIIIKSPASGVKSLKDTKVSGGRLWEVVTADYFRQISLPDCAV